MYKYKERNHDGWNACELMYTLLSDVTMMIPHDRAYCREFLDACHEWMVANIRNQRSPLQVADEITQPRERLLAIDVNLLENRCHSNAYNSDARRFINTNIIIKGV